MSRGALLDISGVKGGAVLDTFSDSGSFRICGAISKLGQLNCQECQFFNLWGDGHVWTLGLPKVLIF